MSIVLRPHHLLCTQGYSGKGYDNDFVAHMTDVVHQLRDVPGTTIRLTFSTDTLCSCCPNKLGEDLCDTQEKVKRYDAKTVEYFGLEEKEYVYQDLIRAIDAKATPEILADICRDCCWFPVSACCKNICEGPAPAVAGDAEQQVDEGAERQEEVADEEVLQIQHCAAEDGETVPCPDIVAQHAGQ